MGLVFLREEDYFLQLLLTKSQKRHKRRTRNLIPLHRLLFCPPWALIVILKDSDLFYIREGDWVVFSLTDEVKQLLWTEGSFYLLKIQGTYDTKTVRSANHFLWTESACINLDAKAIQPNKRILDSLHLVFIPVHKNLCVKREWRGFNISLL